MILLLQQVLEVNIFLIKSLSVSIYWEEIATEQETKVMILNSERQYGWLCRYVEVVKLRNGVVLEKEISLL